MATQTYLKQSSGALTEARTVETSAGAADASKIPNTNSAGVLDPTLLNAANTSAGAGSAAKIVQLDGGGKIDATMMPVGVTADAMTLTASETIAGGSYVNIHISSGIKVRLADAATGKRAYGYAPNAIASGAAGTIYFEGTNGAVTGKTPGAPQFLGAAGATTETAPAVGVSGVVAGHMSQVLGIALSATQINFEPDPPITLA